MAIARIKRWIAGEVLTASDLNAEFDNVVTNGLSLISPLTGNLDVNNNQLTNMRFEVRTATASVSGAGRAYWQSAEGTIHVDTGTLIARIPAITGIQQGFLVGTTNPTAVSGATTYGLVQLGTGLSLVGNVLTPAATALGGYGVRNLVGANNAGTPNTQWDMSADLVVLRNPSDATVVVRANTGTLTNNIATAGSAANGRDQAAAFGASNFLHFYFIWNGTTLATLSSLTAPPTGPSLPTGYTHWGYAGSDYYNGTPLLVGMRWRGSMASYVARQSALSGGVQTVETAVSLATFVPANAGDIDLSIGCTTAGGSSAANFTSIRYIAGTEFDRVWNNGSTVSAVNEKGCLIPNLSQQVLYVAGGGGTVAQASIDVRGYTMPNGGG